MKKVVISLIVVVVFVALFLYLTISKDNDNVGEITVIITDENGVEESAIYGFLKEDSLFDIVNGNYEVKCANSSYGISNECNEIGFSSRVILQIDDIITDWNNDFISIYENDVYSHLGIDSIVLNDGDKFEFMYTEVGAN